LRILPSWGDYIVSRGSWERQSYAKPFGASNEESPSKCSGLPIEARKEETLMFQFHMRFRLKAKLKRFICKLWARLSARKS
jgi:hypothetical protein